MIIFSCILILLLICLVLDSQKTNHKNTAIIIIFCLILTFLSACRKYTVGVDSIQYYTNYTLLGTHSDILQVTRYESGFKLLCEFLYTINSNPQFLFIITSLFIIPSVCRFISKHSSNKILSLILYLTLNVYFFELTGLRQAIAIAIMVYAYDALLNNKKMIFSILIILASLFHQSALLLLLIFILFDKIKYNNKVYFKVLLFTLVSFFAFQPLLGLFSKYFSKYAGYIGSDFGTENYFGALFQFLLSFAIYTVCHFIYVKNSTNSNRNTEFLLKCSALAMYFYAMSMKMSIVGRMAPYFMIYSIILIPNIEKYISTQKNKLLFIVCTLFIAISYWLIIAIYRPEWNGVIPYEFYWK